MSDRSPLDNVPAQDDVYHIWQMRYARTPERRVHQNFLFRHMPDGPMPMDYSLWILCNAHRTIVVDTGMGAKTVAKYGRPVDFDVIDALRQLGVDPDAVEDVILTHLHWDHTGTIECFGKARFHVQDEEVRYATGRLMSEAPVRSPFDVEDVAELVRYIYADRVRFYDGFAEPFPGISLHLMPGHSKGLQALRVLTPRGYVLLTSDASHYYANYLRRQPFGATIDVEATLRTYSQIVEIGGAIDRIVPSHDPQVRALYPRYSFRGVELVALHETPKHHDIAELTLLGTF